MATKRTSDKTSRKTADRPKRLAEGVYSYRGYSICHGIDTMSTLDKPRGWFWLDDKNQRRRASSLKSAVSAVRSYIEFKAERG